MGRVIVGAIRVADGIVEGTAGVIRGVGVFGVQKIVWVEVVGAFGLLQKFWSTEPPFVATFKRGTVTQKNKQLLLLRLLI